MIVRAAGHVVSTMNKTLEYMVSGLPVVAPDLDEIRVSAGGAALYVKPNDILDYAAAIAELVDDEPGRTRQDKLAYVRIEQELAWSHEERAYLDVYERLTVDAMARESAGR